MSEPDSPVFTFAIPGSEETRELSLPAALEAIARGEIEPTHWVWSPAHQDWKPVSEIPALQAAPQAPPVAVTVVKAPTALEVMARLQAKEPIPAEVIVPSRTVSTPSTRSHKVEQHEGGFSIFKLGFFILAVVLLGLIAANYVLVDQPLEMSLAKTPFGTVTVHAHLGAFLQPNALIIHVLPATDVTKDNFADLLVTIAQSTPPQLLNHSTYGSVGLTSAWVTQYIITGDDWKKLGQMDHASEEERRTFILDHVLDATGQPLLATGNSKLEDKVWLEFAGRFAQGT